MYIDIELFAKTEKELKPIIQIIRIHSQAIEMEFGFEKCATLIVKNGKYK